MEERIVKELNRAAERPLTVDITTTGRTSGQPRRIEIWMVKVGARVVIGGTPAPRDWYSNLVSTPEMTLHLKGAVVADLAAVATPVTAPDERHEIWHHHTTSWYRDQTPAAELVASAPTVELRFV